MSVLIDGLVGSIRGYGVFIFVIDSGDGGLIPLILTLKLFS